MPAATGRRPRGGGRRTPFRSRVSSPVLRPPTHTHEAPPEPRRLQPAAGSEAGRVAQAGHGHSFGRKAAHVRPPAQPLFRRRPRRSEEHTSELQSLMRTSYAVFCLTKKKTKPHITLPN